MRTDHVYHAVDSHTEGMPVRVITGGVPTIPGASMAERRLWFMEHRDSLRLLLMREPRGHSAMSGVILQPATRPDADWGVLGASEPLDGGPGPLFDVWSCFGGGGDADP